MVTGTIRKRIERLQDRLGTLLDPKNYKEWLEFKHKQAFPYDPSPIFSFDMLEYYASGCTLKDYREKHPEKFKEITDHWRGEAEFNKRHYFFDPDSAIHDPLPEYPFCGLTEVVAIGILSDLSESDTHLDTLYECQKCEEVFNVTL